MSYTELTDDGTLCRICLNYKDNGTSLFDGDVKAKEILNTLNECFQIVLSYEKNLPSIICNECLKELDIADNFRQKCLTFDKRFLEIYVNNDFNQSEEQDVKADKINYCERLFEYQDDDLGMFIFC